MNHLVKEDSEEEARPYIELLGESNEQYCASLDQLTERLQAREGGISKCEVRSFETSTF